MAGRWSCSCATSGRSTQGLSGNGGFGRARLLPSHTSRTTPARQEPRPPTPRTDSQPAAAGLERPLGGSRPAIKTYRARRIDYPLDPHLVQALKRVGAHDGASFFVTLLAAYVVLLYRLTGQRDLVVGIPSAGQPAEGMPGVVGHCVNMLPVRCNLDPAAPFGAVLQL